MKKLIVSGCSWTKYSMGMTMEPYLRDKDWATHLAKKLDMECINLGCGGAGNEYIFFSIYDELMREKKHSEIGLVVVMWSGWKRWDFELKNYVPISEDRLENIANSWRRPPARVKEDLLKLDFTPWKKSLRYIYMFQELMEQNNIPYMHVQGVRPDWHQFSGRHKAPLMEEGIIEEILRNIYVDKINEDKFIGWPPFLELGGMYMDWYLNELDPNEDKLYLPHSSTSAHPNAEGDKVISNYLYEKIREEYGNL